MEKADIFEAKINWDLALKDRKSMDAAIDRFLSKVQSRAMLKKWVQTRNDPIERPKLIAIAHQYFSDNGQLK